MLVIFSSWIMNCSAANQEKKHKIMIQQIGDGITLGILMKELSDDDKEKLKAEAGAKIVDAIEGSAAEKAGLKAKDVIVSFEGKKIETAKQLDEIVEALEVGTDVKFKVSRDGEEMSFRATLKEMENKGYSYSFSGDDKDDNFVWHFSDGEEGDVSWFSENGAEREILINKIHDGSLQIFENQSNKGGFLGIEGKNISEQMLEYFEVKNGILIEKVLEDTPAEKAGLKAGDVITFIEGRKIEDYKDLVRTLNYYNPKEKVEIQYVRKGSEKNIDVELDEKKGHTFFIDKHGDETIFKGEEGMPHIRMQNKLHDLKDIDTDVRRVFYII